jgi:DNA polymerase III epsilon subunit-like protein
MNFIVIDLELTQNEGSVPRVIQIGAAVMSDDDGRVLATFDELANPGELPNAFITNLTGITADAVAAARPLGDVLVDFWAWIARSQAGQLIFQWGCGDLRHLTEASAALGVDVPRRVRAFDIKLFSLPFRASRGARRRGGLAATMALFNVPFVGRPHRALDDAVAAGRLYAHLVGRIRRLDALERALGVGPGKVVGGRGERGAVGVTEDGPDGKGGAGP